MAIPYDKKMRESAKADGDKFLVQVSISGKYLSDELAAKYQKTFMGHARFETTGPMGYEQAKELWNWYMRWQKKHKRQRASEQKG